MTYESKLVANKILELAKDADDTVTPMQLIKLVYLCHGWMLGIHGRPLISESVEAWKYGPVIPCVYHATKTFRDQPVQGPLELATDGFDGEKPQLDRKAESIVAQVYNIYGSWSGIDLSWLTHKDGSPWSIVFAKNGQSNSVISNDLIEQHYSELYEKSLSNSEQ